MVRLRRTLLHPGLLGVLFVLGLLGTLQTLQALVELHAHNEQVRDPASIVLAEGSPPELVFAKAHALEPTEPLGAIQLYGTLLQQKDVHLVAAVHENLGALYLREAAKLWKKNGLSEYIRINTLLASAKDHLRESLTLEPLGWSSRFNLEYAYRITPPPRERSKDDFQGNKGSVFATLPALPGGGP